MDTIFIRRSLKGKSYVAAGDQEFKGLEGKKCPITGDGFEPEVKKVNAENAEIMGINFREALEGVKGSGLFFGKFKINLGETMIIE